jgi:CheY-like chemotaxis protein
MEDHVERADFAQRVRDVLAHLYDEPYLEKSTVRTLLASSDAPTPVEDLQRAFIEAIQQLKPSRGSPQYVPRWRRYRLLCLRYLEGADPAAIAEELSVGERQVRRDHQDGVDALVTILWAQHSRLRWAGGTLSGDRSPGLSDEASLEAEIRRMVARPPQTALPIGEAIESARATVARLFETRQVSLKLSVPEHIAPVVVDRVVLRQILLNLLAGAIERDTTRHVELSACQDGPEVQLRIRLDHRAQEDGLTVPAGSPGQADPLTASRRLVELHGGVFQHHAEDSREEIAFTLPAVALTTILVIDDNPDFVRLFQRYLVNSAYRIIQAGIADEAVRLARTAQPDLITLDVMMPSQDGWETLQILKSDPATRRIPVLVCSVLHEPSLAHSLGADEFLAKPVTRQGLLTALERCARLVPR